MPDEPIDQRFAAERRTMTEVLQTTEKNLPARMAGLGLGPVCGRCGGTGNYSFNHVHGTTCFGCQGNRVTAPKTAQQWQDALAQARRAVVEGKLESYVAYLAARGAAKRASDTVMAAWTASGIGKQYDWRKACERNEDGSPAHPRDRFLADVNKLIADEHTRISDLSRALQAPNLPREERQARTIALAREVARSVDRIASIAALHLGNDGGDPRAAALARLLNAHGIALSIGALSQLLTRSPPDSEIGQARIVIRAALAAATEAAITGRGADDALRSLIDLTEQSPASLLQQAVRRDWQLYTPYQPGTKELADRCGELQDACRLARAALNDRARSVVLPPVSDPELPTPGPQFGP